MSDNTMIGPISSEVYDAAARPTAFSYCCECGTYDAHVDTCLCCGFDFRAAPLETPPGA